MATADCDARGNGKIYRQAAWATLILCPILASLPPRRLNLMSAFLGGSWLISANYLLQERRHASIKARFDHETPAVQSSGKQAEDARQRRMEYYQDKLDEGAGYGDSIKEQIWDVWNQNRDDKE